MCLAATSRRTATTISSAAVCTQKLSARSRWRLVCVSIANSPESVCQDCNADAQCDSKHRDRNNTKQQRKGFGCDPRHERPRVRFVRIRSHESISNQVATARSIHDQPNNKSASFRQPTLGNNQSLWSNFATNASNSGGNSLETS